MLALNVSRNSQIIMSPGDYLSQEMETVSKVNENTFYVVFGTDEILRQAYSVKVAGLTEIALPLDAKTASPHWLHTMDIITQHFGVIIPILCSQKQM